MSAIAYKIGLWSVSFAAGIATAVVLDFMLFRMGIPLKPFIYVAF